MRFLKILMFVVALAVAVKAVLYYVVPNLRPLPALAVNIKSGDELTRRVLQRFPIGSSAAALKTELEEEGRWSPVRRNNFFNVDERFVVFERPIGLLTTETTIIVWKSDKDDRLIEVRGNILRDSGLP